MRLKLLHGFPQIISSVRKHKVNTRKNNNHDLKIKGRFHTIMWYINQILTGFYPLSPQSPVISGKCFE